MGSKKVNLMETMKTNGILNDKSVSMVSPEHITLLSKDDLIPQTEINSRIYDVNQLDALALDISERGIQSPLKVMTREDGKYSIISGHRRFAANLIAIEKYGYKKGNQIPCKISPAISDSIVVKEQMILDNLQRDKSDFERMEEIAEFKSCTEARRNRGEEVANVRDYVGMRLGVTSSEIQRFLTIYEKLDKDLTCKFRAGLIATNVAYEIARLDSETQAYIYSEWNWENALTFTMMSSLVQQKSAQSMSKTKPSGTENVVNTQPLSYVFSPPKTIEEGISMMDETCNSITKILKNTIPQTNAKVQRALLKRISKQASNLSALLYELESLGLSSENHVE